jgi:hypothetical protein
MEMSSGKWVVVVIALLLALVLALLGCGPSPEGDARANRGATAGMCPHCGSTDLDVQRQTERSAYDGTETETLVMTCRNCGHSWRAPAAIK